MYLGFFLVSGMCQDLTESLTTSVIRQQFRNYTNLPEIFPWNFALKLSQRWVQHYRAHSKWSRGHCCKTETEWAEEVSPSPLSPSSAVSLSQRWVRLAKQIAATISEITGEIAKGKKLRQTRVSVTSQDKYRLLLNSYTGKNLEWYRRPSPFSQTEMMALGKRGCNPTAWTVDLGDGIWRALEWDRIFTEDIYWYDFPSDLIILARLPAPYNPSIVFTSCVHSLCSLAEAESNIALVGACASAWTNRQCFQELTAKKQGHYSLGGRHMYQLGKTVTASSRVWK